VKRYQSQDKPLPLPSKATIHCFVAHPPQQSSQACAVQQQVAFLLAPKAEPGLQPGWTAASGACSCPAHDASATAAAAAPLAAGVAPPAAAAAAAAPAARCRRLQVELCPSPQLATWQSRLQYLQQQQQQVESGESLQNMVSIRRIGTVM
jgi:hypothetical protein